VVIFNQQVARSRSAPTAATVTAGGVDRDLYPARLRLGSQPFELCERGCVRVDKGLYSTG
jgi:hypothetical protein